LGGRKGIRPVKNEWWGAGVVICLEPGADLIIDIFISPVKADKLTNKKQTGEHHKNTHSHTLRPDRPDKTEIHKLKHAIIKQWH